MLANDLFDKILMDPITSGADQLCVVSGYATAAMAFHHLQAGQKKLGKFSVRLIVGMCPNDGLSMSNHKGFQALANVDFKGVFKCSYVVAPPAVHSKAYVWLREGRPVRAFVGSANYTQTAFGKAQRELLVSCDARLAYQYFRSLDSDCVFCNHADVDDMVTVYADKMHRPKRRRGVIARVPPSQNVTGLEYVDVSLLDRHGSLPQRSGLNWGQRPEVHREPNQAYIRLPASVYSTAFFPATGMHFTLLTDDGKVLICTRAQANGKAIHTPHNNSLIGEYFRNRLGLATGARVRDEDLALYGRNTIRFYKIDDETYFMDFSPTA